MDDVHAVLLSAFASLDKCYCQHLSLCEQLQHQGNDPLTPVSMSASLVGKSPLVCTTFVAYVIDV